VRHLTIVNEVEVLDLRASSKIMFGEKGVEGLEHLQGLDLTTDEKVTNYL